VLTRDEILARKAGRGTYKFEDGSGEVQIKGVLHAQAAEVGAAREAGDPTAATALIIHHGLVDPAMSLDDVMAWMASDDAGTLEKLAQEIGRLSNLFEGAPKSGVQKARRR
jgi:hypothetical protein